MIFSQKTLAALLFIVSFSQQSFALERSDSTGLPYRPTAARINDLVNTRLKVKFNYKTHQMPGEAWITLKPHSYPTDSLTLDAKGMDIREVSLVSKAAHLKLGYRYDSLKLRIQLPKTYQAEEIYQIYIAYTAKPDLLKSGGSAAITSDKGLYFINSEGKDKTKPVQIWTQGESESSSCWFPTIDKPNQKTTEEISMTVPARYVTLSNGRLISQKPGNDGTRTDTWEMDKPHAPYLFMMAVGDFKIYHDKWRNIPVDYYLEPRYAPFARQIFGNTPEMIEFYSNTLGIPYPWNKYSQIVVRDYVSGAMENTTATLHGESVQRTARELLDENQEDYIAHELFHQWFGDLATCESWSNLTVNESFAALSEILWSEHKYGKDKADQDRMEKLNEYLNSFPDGKSPELVRFHYKNREDMFDAVSYNKGAMTLYMLRELLGKEVFYEGLHIYLTRNAYRATEAQDLRLALEQASGKDLNPFFNQWYYKGGHPVLSWKSSFDASRKELSITFKQIQDSSIQTFSLPLALDICQGSERERKHLLLNQREQTFKFNTKLNPALVIPDPEHVLVGQLEPEGRSMAQYAFLYQHALNYIDRFQALDTCIKTQNQASSMQVLVKGLDDKSPKLRVFVLDGLKADTKPGAAVMEHIAQMAESDLSTLCKAAALDFLGRTGENKYAPLFKKGLHAQSLAVCGASLKGLSQTNPDLALIEAARLDQEKSPKILEAVGSLYVSGGLDRHAAFFERAFSLSPDKFTVVFRSYLEFLVASRNTDVVTRGVTLVRDRIESLHSVPYEQAVSASFRNMAEAKRSMASSQLDPKVKSALINQAMYLEQNAAAMSKAN